MAAGLSVGCVDVLAVTWYASRRHRLVAELAARPRFDDDADLD